MNWSSDNQFIRWLAVLHDSACRRRAQSVSHRRDSSTAFTVHILIDHAALVRGDVSDGEVCEIAHLGRHIPAELRTALIVAGRECDIEGCAHRGYLEIDHTEIDYANGGPTAWWNLTWLCSIHHKRKTAGATLGPPNPHTRKRTINRPENDTDQTTDARAA